MLKKYKLINNLLFIIGFISILLFMLSHYMFINLTPFHARGYYLFMFVFVISIGIATYYDIKIRKLEGHNIKWYSFIFEILIYGFILAYSIYLYTIPVGTCPIKQLFSDHNYTHQERLR